MSDVDESVNEVEQVLVRSVDISESVLEKANEEEIYKKRAESIVQFSEPLIDAGFTYNQVVDLFIELDEFIEGEMEE